MSSKNETFLAALPKQDHIYYNTYFRIEAGYRWGEGMSKEATMRFFDELKSLFTTAGWTAEESRIDSGCLTIYKGGNHLYCHPMELVGPCESSLRSDVTEILSHAKTCVLRTIDIYNQVYDVSDEQYRTALEAARKDIEQDLMTAFSTNRRDIYHHGYYSGVDNVAEHYRVPTLDRSTGVICSDDVHIRYITDVFQDLVEQGKILYKESKQGRKMFRAATGPELLELARRQAASLNAKVQNAHARIRAQTADERIPSITIEPPSRA